MAADAPSSPKRRSKQRIATRERLYVAAVEEFRRSGFANAQIDAIARSAGVVRGTFYFHFPSKEHVLLEMQQRFSHQLADHLKEFEHAPFSLEQILSRLAQGITEITTDLGAPELVRDMLAAYARAPLEAEVADSLSPLGDQLVVLFRAAADRGELRRDLAPEQLALLLLTSLFGVLLSQTGPSQTPAVDVDALMAVMLRGIAA